MMTDNIDSEAFENMQAADPDYVAGGSIMFKSPFQTLATSDYDDKMTPEEQGEFERMNMKVFHKLYQTDPNLKNANLNYMNYLKNLDPELIEMRATEFDDITEGDANAEVPVELETAKAISVLAQKHYGDIDRLRNMALGLK